MSKVARIRSFDTVIAGLVASLLAVTPAFAATWPFEVPFGRTGMPMRDWLLMGSLALLAIALALRLIRRRSAVDPRVDADAPDLRWWRNQ